MHKRVQNSHWTYIIACFIQHDCNKVRVLLHLVQMIEFPENIQVTLITDGYHDGIVNGIAREETRNLYDIHSVL